MFADLSTGLFLAQFMSTINILVFGRSKGKTINVPMTIAAVTMIVLATGQIIVDTTNIFKAFNEELDGMFQDANLPDTEAWTAMTADLQKAKADRNQLSKENAYVLQSCSLFVNRVH